MLRKTFKYRCYTNKQTIKNAKRIFRIQGDIWCNALKDRQKRNGPWDEAYADEIKKYIGQHEKEPSTKERRKIAEKINKTFKKHVYSHKDQYHIVRLRDHKNDTAWVEKYGLLNSQMRQAVLMRQDEAFKSYYGNKKSGDIEARKPGRKREFCCITFRQSGWRLDNNILVLAGVGRFRIRLHRRIEGRIKTISITEKNGKWYACFSCEIEKKTGMCSPVQGPKSIKDKGLPQEYYLSGGSDPQKTGIYNKTEANALRRMGGSDPQKTGIYNRIAVANKLISGGSGPQKISTYNPSRIFSTALVDGSDPQKNEHGKRIIELAFRIRDNHFLIDSERRIINHPDFYIECLEKLAELNRRLDRKQIHYICKKCGHEHIKVPSKKICQGCGVHLEYYKHHSKNWLKAKYTLEKFHEKLANKRAYFLWNIAKFYAANYETITIPNWPLKKQIEYAVNNKTAIRLTDGSYAKFIEMLKHKCNEYGRTLIVGPENKELKERAKKLDLQKAKLKKVKRMLKKANLKLRKEAI